MADSCRKAKHIFTYKPLRFEKLWMNIVIPIALPTFIIFRASKIISPGVKAGGRLL